MFFSKRLELCSIQFTLGFWVFGDRFDADMIAERFEAGPSRLMASRTTFGRLGRGGVFAGLPQGRRPDLLKRGAEIVEDDDVAKAFEDEGELMLLVNHSSDKRKGGFNSLSSKDLSQPRSRSRRLRREHQQ